MVWTFPVAINRLTVQCAGAIDLMQAEPHRVRTLDAATIELSPERNPRWPIKPKRLASRGSRSRNPARVTVSSE
jgi:hypothetical protein